MLPLSAQRLRLIQMLWRGSGSLQSCSCSWFPGLYSKAAQTLGGIDFDSGRSSLDADYKLRKCVEIAMLYLEDEDPVNAETYIKKASGYLNSTTRKVSKSLIFYGIVRGI